MSKRIAELTDGETFAECRVQVCSVRVQNAATGPCLVFRLGDETGTRWARRWKATKSEQEHALAARTLYVTGRVRTDGRFAGDLEITELKCLVSISYPLKHQETLMNTNQRAGSYSASNDLDDDPKDDFDWQSDAESGWESYVGVSRDDPDWEMMEEIAADAMFERSERD